MEIFTLLKRLFSRQHIETGHQISMKEASTVSASPSHVQDKKEKELSGHSTSPEVDIHSNSYPIRTEQLPRRHITHADETPGRKSFWKCLKDSPSTVGPADRLMGSDMMHESAYVNHMSDVIRDVNSMIATVQGYSEQKLHAGFAVLMIDAKNNYWILGKKDREIYTNVLHPILEDDGHHPEWDTLLKDHTVEDASIIRNAKNGMLRAQDIRDRLGDDEIVTSVHVNTGKRLSEKFLHNLRESICGENGPYEKLNKDLLGQKELPYSITATILAGCFSASVVWIPLSVYAALLLAKASLKTYCEGDESPEGVMSGS